MTIENFTTDVGQLPCLNLSLRKATRTMNRIYDHYLAPAGVNNGQFSILRAVFKLGEATNKTLQTVLALDQSTLTRNLKPLIREGYLTVTPGADRRQRNLQLSDSGKAVYKEAEQYWLNAQREIYQKLGAEFSHQLLGLSDAIVKLT